jgi:chromosome segregation protein
MRIERVEVNGFKSFADKTTFNLHPGMTGIVGPNGCGKSNIVDALKWVLGEQSAKSLRGGNMSDVIFAGSSTKKTKGMAEVTLVLTDIIKNQADNPESAGADQAMKVSVTRRLYRSGESEYLMNKVPCRLKDIKNMFLDTGLELKAYSILEQGKIGDIINSKPIDRRFLIEEVAGVMKYKVRKNEAMSKLESSKSNLQRIQDIIAEVKRQINAVDRYARKAERYKKLYDEIKDIELRVSKRDFNALQADIAGLTSSEESLKSREAEVSANVHSQEALIEEKKRLCVEHDKKLGEIRMSLYSLERETTEDEGRIALLKSDCDNLRERSDDLVRQDSGLAAEKDTTLASIKEIEERRSGMEEEFTVLENEMNEKSGSFTEAENRIIEFEKGLEDLRTDLFNKAEEISGIKNEKNHITLNIDNLNRKTDKSSDDINTLKTNLTSLKASIEQTENELRGFESELQESRKSKEKILNRLKDKKNALAENEKALYSEREGLAAMNSKLESLKELEQSQRSSVDKSIKMKCQVSDILDAPAEYETAIEAILGDKLGAAVVEDQGEITRALELIRQQKTRRSGFITANPLRKMPSGPSIEGSGIIGEAAKFISAKEGFSGIASSLLSGVYLVNNLETAFSLWSTHSDESGKAFYFVTLDGEVLEPSGMVFGGSDKGVLKIKRMIKGLSTEIYEKRSKIAGLEKTVASIKDEIVTLENDNISIDGIISGKEKYSHEMNVKLSGMKEENERLRKKNELITIEMTGDTREKETLMSALEEQKGRCSSLEAEKLKIEGEITSVQGNLSSRRESLESMRTGLTEIKIDLTSMREKMSATSREIERLRGMISDIHKKREEMSAERANIKEAILNKEQEVADKENALKSKVVSAAELQSEASKLNEILEAKKAELEIMEKQQKTLFSELETIRTELGHVEMKKMELSMKVNYLKEDIHKTYSVEIDTVEVPDAVSAEDEEKLPQLKDKIQKIGPVSMGTLEEYEELKSRYEFLTKQRDDLMNSIDALEDTIRKINRTSKKKLEEAFEALNEKFKEVFTILFGKGKAELQLTEGSILDAGIDIVAQPPGKRLQNIMLLSGGEKALTAISLLFAGFMIKPTPMCLLDEVDAPLDESNTDRFLVLLKKLSEKIQFVTITHNRRTMEAADYLYGITMEEPGSSKVISMHLAEAAV